MSEVIGALVVGANRGIGLGVVAEMLQRGWSVIATARQPAQATALADLARAHPGRLEILPLDMNDPAALEAFPAALGGQPIGVNRGQPMGVNGGQPTGVTASRTLDVVLINAGIAGPDHRSADKCTVEEIGELMFTNAIAPIRLARLVAGRMRAKTGVLGFTSSVMGSVALNGGGHELYRASKAALNSLSRGLWPELRGRGLTLLTLHPGWVRTDMGGPSAAVSVADSARGMVDVLTAERGRHHHVFLDYTGKTIDW